MLHSRPTKSPKPASSQKHSKTHKKTNKSHLNKTPKRSVCKIALDKFRKDSSPSYNNVPVADTALRGSLTHTHNLLSSGQITSEQLLESTIEQIKDINPSTNAFITIADANTILDQASGADQRFQNKQTLSKIDGIPISIKDNIHVRGLPSTAGSQFLRGSISQYDATVVKRLRDAGAIVVGKTNLDEFGMGSYGSNSSFGQSISIFDPKKVSELSDFNHTSLSTTSTSSTTPSPKQFQYLPGGSSSGSAVSLQQYTAFASIGTDTGGSVRLPAAFTGTVGFKPTYGSLSRHGLIAYGSSLDCPGIMTRTVADAQIVFDIVAGADENDSTCIFDPRSVPSHFPTLSQSTQHHNNNNNSNDTTTTTTTTTTTSTTTTQPLKGLKVGIPIELMFADLSPQIKQVWDQAAQLVTSLGGQVFTVSAPTLKHALPVYYTLAQSEAVSNLARYDGLRYGSTHYTNSPEYEIGFYKPQTDSNSSSSTTSSSSSSSSTETSITSTDSTSTLPSSSNPNISPLQKLYSSNRELFFGPEVKQRLLVGNFVLSSSHYSSYIEKSMNLRKELTLELMDVMYSTKLTPEQRHSPEIHENTQVDIILTPTSTVLPPSIATIEKQRQENSSQAALAAYVDDVMTVFANLAGVPALSLPFAVGSGENGEKLPIGIQLIGAPCADKQLLEIGAVFQQHVKL